MENNADTVTPLDGDGRNVVEEAPPGDAAAPPVDTSVPVDENAEPTVANVAPQDYEPRGDTTVVAVQGYEVVPSNQDLPVVTSEGVKMTAEEAEEVVLNSNDRAYIAIEDEED